ncbi:MAG: Na+/H+ antiporter subunit E [Pseudomonadota bacterium]
MRIRENNAEQSDAIDESGNRQFQRIKQTAPSFILTFVIAIATWIVLSGRFDMFHMSLGVMSCLIVSFFSHNLLFYNTDIRRLPSAWLRFLHFLPWLIYQVFVANIHVMYLVFHPHMMDLIDPRIIQFKSRLKHPMSHFIFANSITLTPGTVTVHVSLLGNYSVHAIDALSGEALPGDMEEKISRILDE